MRPPRGTRLWFLSSRAPKKPAPNPTHGTHQVRRKGAEFDDGEEVDDYDLPAPGPSALEEAAQLAQTEAHAAARDQLAGSDVDPVRRHRPFGQLVGYAFALTTT